MQATMQNIFRIVKAARDSDRIPVLIFSYPPAVYMDGDTTGFSAQPIALCGLPDGSPLPYTTCQADWEVGEREINAINARLRLWVNTSTFAPVDWVDEQRAFEYFSNGHPWRGLGDQRLVSAEGQGHCSCIRDSDCGPGGVCTDNQFCSAGTRSTCTTEPDCWGANSQAHPGEGFCIDEGRWWLVKAIRDGCLLNKSVNQEPYYLTEGIADCTHMAGRPPGCAPWPTYTVAETATATATRTATPVYSPTSTRTPIDTPTPGGPTLTPTSTNTVTPTPATPSPLSCDAPGNCCNGSAACNKLATLYRPMWRARSWQAHIGSDLGNGDHFLY
ncbi:MAG: hypothetical protein ACRETD_14315, partial [Steroidobacteraceae bacterium]